MQREVERLVARAPGRWSVRVEHEGNVVADLGSDQILATASMGKVFLLIAVATRIIEGSLSPDEVLSAHGDECVADSGLWQYFGDSALRLDSLAVLVAAVSDNRATNVLLRRIGLAEVGEVSDRLGVPRTRLVDRIRDEREPEDPPFPSVGCAANLVVTMDAIARDDVLAPGVGPMVASWLSTNVDLSLVAAGLGLDPLAHTAEGLVNKTGTDVGVLADAGCLDQGGGRWTYAVIANWSSTDDEDTRRVRAGMREIGLLMARSPRRMQ